MSLSMRLPTLPTPLVALLLTSVLPTASADSGAAGRVDAAGFWISFCLLVVVSAVESVCSFIWTRYRVVTDGSRPCELSCRVCGREVFLTTIDAGQAAEIAKSGLPVGCHSGSTSSFEYSMNGVVVSSSSGYNGCSTCGGFERKRTEGSCSTTEVVIDKFGSIIMMPSLFIRRFNPTTSLEAPTGLVNNIKDLIRLGEDMTIGRMLERAVHLIVGVADISLGAAGLALNSRSPQRLYDTLKDPKAPMTFENYSTLFLLYWLLGVLLLLCIIPLRSKRRSIQMFGWPGTIAYGVAALASLVLFALGCWKIDYARRHDLPWTPMVSYWIGGASAISFAPLGIEVFHTFGVVGLVLMLIHIL